MDWNPAPLLSILKDSDLHWANFFLSSSYEIEPKWKFKHAYKEPNFNISSVRQKCSYFSKLGAVISAGGYKILS